MNPSPIRDELRASISQLSATLEPDPDAASPAQGRSQKRPTPGHSRWNPALAGALLVTAVVLGAALWIAQGGDPSDVQAVRPEVSSTATSTSAAANRSNGRIASFDDLVRTADTVAIVEVLSEASTREEVRPGEETFHRTLTVSVQETVAGSTPEPMIKIFVGPASAGAYSGPLPGDRVLVALASQPNGEYEFNGGSAFFPLGSPTAARRLATTRALSPDPGTSDIGKVTEGLAEDELVALVQSVP